MIIKTFHIYLLISTFICFSCRNTKQDQDTSRIIACTECENLKNTYIKEYEGAKAQFKAPNQLTRVERYNLGYSAYPNQSTDQKIGRLILVLESQKTAVEHYLNKLPNTAINKKIPPNENQTKVVMGLAISKQKMKLSCGKLCKNSKERKEYRKIVDDLFKIIDIKDSYNSFSGLPFYKIVEHEIFKPEFQDKVIRLHDELSVIVGKFANDKNFNLKTNIFNLAMKVTNGNQEESIKLLGILLSRDSSIIRYLEYLSPHNRKFVKAFAQTPIIVKLISHLDRKSSGLSFDRFSYPKGVQFLDERNYYFWSSALLGQNLKKLGYNKKLTRIAINNFLLNYKFLRYLEAQGLINSLINSKQWDIKFKENSMKALRISNRGGSFGLNMEVNNINNLDQLKTSIIVKVKNTCSQLLQRLLRN